MRLLRTIIPLLPAAALAGLASAASAATIYHDGVTPALSGVYDLGAHLPNYIGGTVGSAADGTLLDGNRVYLFDVNAPYTPETAPAASFNLLVWQFASPKDSVRLYTHQDHYGGGPIPDDNFTANEVLEYSVWGCNGPTGACKTSAEWTLLSDPIGYTFPVAGKPEYTFAGTDAAEIFRGGSAEFGIVNAYVQDFTFSASYDFFAIRGSTIAMNASTADPELDAMVAFNRVDVPLPDGSVPEPFTLSIFGAGLVGSVAMRRRKKNSA